MKLNFRYRLFLYIATLFTVFAIGIGVFEHYREKIIKTEGLEEKLDVYAQLIQSSLSDNSNNYKQVVQKLESTFPPDLRITIIDPQGNILYDNALGNFSRMENHANRNEIKAADLRGNGSDIRKSESTNQPYLYYAKKFNNHYIRVALPYDIQLQRFLKTDNLFLYFLLGLFILTLIVIHRITRQFGDSIKQLRDFAINSDHNDLSFGDDELGEISRKISENYHLLELNEKKISLEKQKLLQHIQISEEGICFISPERKIELYNGLFIQYLNQLVDESKSNPKTILTDPFFSSIHQFIEQTEIKYFETEIKKQGKIFSLRANLFDDGSSEVIITDVTQQEKTKQLKQEMTGNIAHELRTPITSIRAYLETIIDQSLPEEKQKHFIKQAFYQTLTLSDMIKDMSIIAKLEEAPDSFTLENIDLTKLLNEIKEEHKSVLERSQIQMQYQFPQNLTINGNLSLLTSIFRNLIENSIRYAGEQIQINISLLNEDDEFYYFSYYDTGIGIRNEEHLNRIFERFYRVQEGRTRDTGGSGLGLSIVKNAVLFHKGNISVKNRKGGGLEFMFSLKKH
ncbi:MAG: ATP-binding protein [Bacteroidia bacterium]|nr:ATP-binding protein [Bacteroidia bacterium]